MMICRGTPQYTGHYVCYMHGVAVPTVVRFWLAGGHGWIDHLKDDAPIAGTCAGWIGPLPLDTVAANEALGRKPTPPVQEFDL